MSKKIKVLTISDHPLSPSGVGTQTKYVIEALLNSGKFEVISLGGAMKHTDYTPKAVDPYGEDWKIIPVDGYFGTTVTLEESSLDLCYGGGKSGSTNVTYLEKPK